MVTDVGGLTGVVVLQYIHIVTHFIVHLKLVRCGQSYLSKNIPNSVFPILRLSISKIKLRFDLKKQTPHAHTEKGRAGGGRESWGPQLEGAKDRDI